MKFIKDIIGEKRDQVPMSPAEGGALHSAATPDRDMLTSILAETRANAQPNGQPAAPLKLDAASRVVQPTPSREDVAPVDVSQPAVSQPTDTAPDEDALTAFLAERNRAVQSVATQRPDVAPQTAEGFDVANEAEAEDLEAAADPLTADGSLDRPYRIFTRRNRTKMLRLEAAAEAASVGGRGFDVDTDQDVEDAGFADDFAQDDQTEHYPEHHTDMALLDQGPDEFLHIRETASASGARAEDGLRGLSDAADLSDTDELSGGHDLSQSFGSGAPVRGKNADPGHGADPTRQDVTPDPVKLVTDPAFTAQADVADDRLDDKEDEATDAQAGPTPMRVVAATPVSQGPVLGAAFPEPAFAETAAAAGVDLGEADLGLPMGRAGRVKTRLLGFDADMGVGDPFAQTGVSGDGGVTQFPVGWLVVIDGPGRGAGFTLFAGVSVIGRGEGQTVRLDFGDSSISRDQHAAIAFDPEQQGFFIGHGGKANLVRRNGRPVLSTEALAPGDVIRVGETTLRFVPLCGPEFSWQDGAHLG